MSRFRANRAGAICRVARRGLRRFATYAVAAAAVAAAFSFGAPPHRAFAAPPQKTYDLRRTFVLEAAHYYVFEREQSDSQTITLLMPTPYVTRQRVIEDYRETTCNPLPDGLFEVSYILERAQLHRTDNNRKKNIQYDSLTDQPGPETTMLAAIIQHPISAKLRVSGLGDSVPPPASAPSVVRDMPVAAATAPASAPAAASRPVGGAASSRPAAVRRPVTPRKAPAEFDRDVVLERVTRWTHDWLPDAPVAVGESWWLHFSELRATFVLLRHDLKFTLREVRETDGRTLAVIDMTGGCRIDISSDTPQAENQTREVTLKSAAWSGEFTFDLTRGRLDRATIRHDHDLAADMKSAKAGGIDITLGNSAQRTWTIRSSDNPPPRPIVAQSSRSASGGRAPRPPRPVPPAQKPASAPGGARPTGQNR